MGRIAVFIYGVVTYVAFLVVFLYAFGFMSGLGVPKSIDDGQKGPVGQAIVINVLLLALFAVQHSVMARPAFKSWWTKIIPEPIERSTFVLMTNLVLGLLFWQWRPIPEVVWKVDHQVAYMVLRGLFFAGALIVLYSSFLIDHFDLFGLRQVYFYLRGREYAPPVFMVRSLYKWVRHPLMLGFMIAFWSAPTMTLGHLLFSLVTTVYIFVGIALEERDIGKQLGEEYQRYRQRTPMILPFPKR